MDDGDEDHASGEDRRPRPTLSVDTASRRILRILDRYIVASKQTLEAKISEAGPFNQRVEPLAITKALPLLLGLHKIREVRSSTSSRCALYALPIGYATEDSVNSEIERKSRLHETYNNSSNSLGSASETVFRDAFVASPNVNLIQTEPVTEYNGVTIPNSADALIHSVNPSGEMAATAGVALVEIKNRREWIYHDNPHLWELIKCAYLMDVVPVFIARRIALSTFKYALKRVGGVGIEAFFQFASPSSESQLAPVKHKEGLGYHDLTFSTEVPPSVQKQVNALGSRIYVARKRMLQIRDTIAPYLSVLGGPADRDQRRVAYKELDRKIREFDYRSPKGAYIPRKTNLP